MKLYPFLMLVLSMFAGCYRSRDEVSRDQFMALYDKDRTQIAYNKYVGRQGNKLVIEEYNLGNGTVVHKTGQYWIYANRLPANWPTHPQKPITTITTPANQLKIK